MISPHTVFTFADSVQGTESNGEIVVLDLKSERFFGLNETGSRLWQELACGQSLDQALQTLQAEFEVDLSTLQDDTQCLVQQWIAREWIRPQAAASR